MYIYIFVFLFSLLICIYVYIIYIYMYYLCVYIYMYICIYISTRWPIIFKTLLLIVINSFGWDWFSKIRVPSKDMTHAVWRQMAVDLDASDVHSLYIWTPSFIYVHIRIYIYICFCCHSREAKIHIYIHIYITPWQKDPKQLGAKWRKPTQMGSPSRARVHEVGSTSSGHRIRSWGFRY